MKKINNWHNFKIEIDNAKVSIHELTLSGSPWTLERVGAGDHELAVILRSSSASQYSWQMVSMLLTKMFISARTLLR